MVVGDGRLWRLPRSGYENKLSWPQRHFGNRGAGRQVIVGQGSQELHRITELGLHVGASFGVKLRKAVDPDQLHRRGRRHLELIQTRRQVCILASVDIHRPVINAITAATFKDVQSCGAGNLRRGFHSCFIPIREDAIPLLLGKEAPKHCFSEGFTRNVRP